MDWLQIARENVRLLERDGGRSEQDTVHGVVVPLLAWLGFEPWDLSRVQFEYPVKDVKNRWVDITVLEGKRVILAVEVKALGNDLREARLQLGDVARLPGAPRFNVATDGRRWWLHDRKWEAVADNERVILKLDVARDEEARLLHCLKPEHREALKSYAGKHRRVYEKFTDDEGMEEEREAALRPGREKLLEALGEGEVDGGAVEAVKNRHLKSPGGIGPSTPQVPPQPVQLQFDRPNANYHKKVLTGASIGNQNLSCRKWGALIIETVEFIIRKKGIWRLPPIRMGNTDIIADDEAHAKTVFARQKGTLNNKKLSTGQYLCVNYAPNEAVAIARSLLKHWGFKPDSLRIEARDR